MKRRVSRPLAPVMVMLCVSSVVLRAVSQTGNPQPKDAVTAILEAFDHYDIVGMNAAHSNEKQDQFILSLVRNPEFPRKANIIVTECGDSKYQPILDRYIAGENIAIEDVRQAWRHTSVLMCALSGFYDGFFSAVRALNQNLPPANRLRVLVAEPPNDWTATGPSSTRASADRNPMITAILTAEVLEKHRKALVLCGVGHLFHNEARGTAVTAYEEKYPGRTFVIDVHNGFAAFFDLERGRQLEARMRTWPTPSIVPVKGSWLADLDLPYFFWPFPKRMAGQSYADLVDAYLYLGPGSSLTYEQTPDTILNDQTYIDELSRRFGPVDVEALRRRNLERRLFTIADRAEARQFAPGAECAGTYAGERGGAPVIEIDFRNGALSARFADSKTWMPLTVDGASMRYRLTSPDGSLSLEFEDVAGSVNRLTIDSGDRAPRRALVRS